MYLVACAEGEREEEKIRQREEKRREEKRNISYVLMHVVVRKL